MKSLNNLTKEDFDKIKSTGMLWELFPEAPEFWEEMIDNLQENDTIPT